LDVNWLQDFVCLARTLNFTRAADERNITQSAFSRRIKALEIWAGTPLIDRSTYPIKLSDAGQDFLPVAKEVTLTLLRNRDDLRARDRGGLRFHGFAAPHSVSITHLAPHLKALEETDPALRTRVVSDNLNTCCQLLSDGDCEFLMCYRHPHIPLTLDEQEFARIDLGPERLVPVVIPDETGAPAWVLPGRRSARIPHLAYAKGSFLRAVVDHTLDGKMAALEVRHMDAFAEALKTLTLQGGGISWLSESSIRSALSFGHLIPAGDEEWYANLTLSVFTAPERLDRTGARIWSYFKDIRGGGTTLPTD